MNHIKLAYQAGVQQALADAGLLKVSATPDYDPYHQQPYMRLTPEELDEQQKAHAAHQAKIQSGEIPAPPPDPSHRSGALRAADARRGIWRRRLGYGAGGLAAGLGLYGLHRALNSDD